MKLREFLNYRHTCPVCLSSSLNTVFHSNKRQRIRDENNRFLVIFDLNGIKKHQKHYKVGYSIDYLSNQFNIEFYSYEGHWMEKEVSIVLLNRFKSLDKNQNKYKIYKHCNICRRYEYTSNDFVLNYKTCSIGDLSVRTESFGLQKTYEDGYKTYDLSNYYELNESVIGYGKLPDKNAKYKLKYLKTPIIKFTTREEVINRLDKLILFS